MTQELKGYTSKLNMFLIVLALGFVMYALKDYQKKKTLAKTSVETSVSSNNTGVVFSKK